MNNSICCHVVNSWFMLIACYDRSVNVVNVVNAVNVVNVVNAVNAVNVVNAVT